MVCCRKLGLSSVTFLNLGIVGFHVGLRRVEKTKQEWS